MKSNIIDIPKEINISNKKQSLTKLLETVNLMSSHPESHIKLYKSKEKKYTAIFSWQSRNKWKIDCPVELNKIHKQRYATKQQCFYFLKEIYNKKEIKPEDNFLDVPIQHFTLDEMLEFKREDDMLLRGEDPNINNQTIKAQPKNTIQSPAKKTTPTVQKKSKSQSLQTLGNHIKPKLETPKPNLNKIAEKIIKNKPTDDNSFFQI
ncbi:hypothetical protein [uncultured Algibacter sp.]|uniref:hypothetical protein n=1 Tax=uncultured Algibacter sp. TaxID=298659 RepID=UPI003216D664